MQAHRTSRLVTELTHRIDRSIQLIERVTRAGGAEALGLRRRDEHRYTVQVVGL